MKRSIIRPLLSVTALVPLVGVTAKAEVWTLQANNGTWNTTANWNESAPFDNNSTASGVGPYADGVGVVADFSKLSLTNNRSVNVNIDATLGGVLIGNAGSNQGYGWNLKSFSGAKTWTLDNGGAGASISLISGGNSTIGDVNGTSPVNFALADNLVVTNSTASSLSIYAPTSGTGNISLNANGTGALSWSVGVINNAGTFTNSGTGAGTVTVGSVIDANVTGVTQSSATSKLVLGGANTYTGATTVSAGTLELAAANRIADTGSLVLSGGTFATGGFSETLGTLELLGNATIDLGDGASALVFADSSGVSWAGSISLSFVNYTDGVDSIRFGTDQNGLLISQLGQITINGEVASIDGSGFLTLVSVPEPSVFGLLVGCAGLAFAASRRRR